MFKNVYVARATKLNLDPKSTTGTPESRVHIQTVITFGQQGSVKVKRRNIQHSASIRTHLG